MEDSQDLWQRIQDLFYEALEQPPSERDAFLEAACAGDDALRKQIQSLLDADARDDTFLDPGRAQLAADVLASGPGFADVGPYRVVRELGRGGTGIVYLGRRDDLDSLAAIKVLRDASLSPARRERFLKEQRVLAHLTHPSIARLYDADTLPDGSPFFVMEYVDGLPLTEYCERRPSSLRERLAVFSDACEAVRFAHGRAVVHRDLKPSNILVRDEPQGATPSVKLLDFGIAKQLEDITAPATATAGPLRLYTPAYAAPEQIRDEPVGVFTDVYALGVILYELLTGTSPYGDLASLSPRAVEEAALEADPEAPSLVAQRRAGGGVGPEIQQGTGGRVDSEAQRRTAAGVPFEDLTATEWRDLDALCLKALAKEPAERYGSIEAMIRDLERFSSGLPLEARQRTSGYRISKFLRRNRRELTLAGGIVAMLTAVLIFYITGITAARDEARAEAARTQRIQQFMLGLFEGEDDAVGPADTLRARTLLDRGVREAGALEDEPTVQAELLATLGGLYQHLGELDLADSLLHRSVSLRREHFGADHPRVAETLIAIGELRLEQARYDEAEATVRDGLDVLRRRRDEAHPSIAAALTALGGVMQERGEYDQAIELLEEAVRLRAAQDTAGTDLSESMTELANAHFYAGDYAAADSINRLVLALDERIHGRRHPLVAKSLMNLGLTRSQLQDYEAAEVFYRQALAINLAYYGSEHPETAANQMVLGQMLVYTGDLDEAQRLLEPALATRERIYGPHHPRVANVHNELGHLARLQKNPQAAEAHYDRMLAIYKEIYEEEHYLMGIALSNLASIYHDYDDYPRCEEALREAERIFRETLSPEHMNTAIARIKLGNILRYQKKYVQARPFLEAGYETLMQQAEPAPGWLRIVLDALVEVHGGLGETDDAAARQNELDALAEAA